MGSMTLPPSPRPILASQWVPEGRLLRSKPPMPSFSSISWTAFPLPSPSRKIAGHRVESVYVGLGLSVAGMIAAAFGHITPVQGALLQEVIDVAVILNALRALRDRQPVRAIVVELACSRPMSLVPSLDCCLYLRGPPKCCAETITKASDVMVRDVVTIGRRARQPGRSDLGRLLDPVAARPGPLSVAATSEERLVLILAWAKSQIACTHRTPPDSFPNCDQAKSASWPLSQ